MLSVVALAAAIALARVRRVDLQAIPAAAWALWLVVAIPSVLQWPLPILLDALERVPAKINDTNQWWRVLTSAVVQDGGFAGTVVNLTALAVVAVVAAKTIGPARMLVVFGFAQLILGLLLTMVFPTVGAGNSVATFALAASIAGMVAIGQPTLADSVLIIVLLAAALVLVVLDDAHGIALLVGVVIGAVTGVLVPPRHQLRPAVR